MGANPGMCSTSRHDVKKGFPYRGNFVKVWLLKILCCLLYSVKSCCQFTWHRFEQLPESAFAECLFGIETWGKALLPLILLRALCPKTQRDWRLLLFLFFGYMLFHRRIKCKTRARELRKILKLKRRCRARILKFRQEIQ